MIRTLTIIVVMLLVSTIASGVQAKTADYLIYTAGGRPVTDKALVELVNNYDVIIFGEYHDNAVLHNIELELLQNIFAIQPKLIVSLEMFECDVQGQLDAYLSGQITEQEFLAKSRPWKNYQEAYRSLVEFAKVQSLPVIAANIPRPLAARYARSGSLERIPAKMAGYLPKVHFAPEGEYQKKFLSYMSSSKTTSKIHISNDKLENYYRAQCLKDDTMAESIIKYLQLQPEYKIIHYQGDFHSRQRLGVVEKLKLLKPELKIIVFAPVYMKDFDNLRSVFEQNQNAGDILVFVKEK